MASICVHQCRDSSCLLRTGDEQTSRQWTLLLALGKAHMICAASTAAAPAACSLCHLRAAHQSCWTTLAQPTEAHMQDHARSMHGAALHGGLLYRPKLLRSSLQAPATLLHLSPCPRGSLGSLVPRPLPSAVPGPGQVLLHVEAVGLNFRDVLNVLGMYPGDPGEPGSDVSGVVAALGPGTEALHR